MCGALTACKPKHESSADEREWKSFTSETGKFSVNFPGKPVETTSISPTAVGDIEVHCFIVELRVMTYGISYSDVPAGVKLPDSETVFDGSQNSAVKDVGGSKAELVDQQSMTVQDFPAREFEFKAGGKGNFSSRVRMILVGHRIYSLTTVFLTANPDPENRKKFFDSFSVHKKQQAPKPDFRHDPKNQA